MVSRKIMAVVVAEVQMRRVDGRWRAESYVVK